PSVGAPASRSCRSLFAFIWNQDRVRWAEQLCVDRRLAPPRLDVVGQQRLEGSDHFALAGENVMKRVAGKAPPANGPAPLLRKEHPCRGVPDLETRTDETPTGERDRTE